METGLREFNNIQELLKYIDSELLDLRKKLGELLRLIEELRAKSEQDEKLIRLISMLTGKPGEAKAPETVIKLDRITIAVNPSAKTELSFYERLAEYINNKVVRLQSIKKDLEKLAETDIEARILVVLHDGIPEAIIIRTR